jgi:hypothetical protein
LLFQKYCKASSNGDDLVHSINNKRHQTASHHKSAIPNSIQEVVSEIDSRRSLLISYFTSIKPVLCTN